MKIWEKLQKNFYKKFSVKNRIFILIKQFKYFQDLLKSLKY